MKSTHLRVSDLGGFHRLASDATEREAILAALNGVLGDYLVVSGNPLAIAMRVRTAGLPLAISRRLRWPLRSRSLRARCSCSRTGCA